MSNGLKECNLSALMVMQVDFKFKDILDFVMN